MPLITVGLVAAALTLPLPYFRERPGRVVSLGACVDVDADTATALTGDVLLMTISLLPTTPVDLVTAALDPATDVVKKQAVVPQGVDTRQYFDDQRKVFGAVADDAAAVGLRAAGLTVPVTGDGVGVLAIAPGTPAEGVLEPGDVITQIDGERIALEEDLRDAVVVAAREERALRLLVRRGERDVPITLTPAVRNGQPVIGIQPETLNRRVRLPVPVKVLSGSVGGPSGGLTVALTVYDKYLADVDLVAGRVVAGTGTIDAQGRVGPIGGVGLKVIAAERQDADVFLAPAANFEAARAALPDGSDMQIMRVATFEEARAALLDSAPAADEVEAATPAECPYS